MSGIPTWQAGTTYAPGALVVPSSSPAVAQVQPANAGFEAGTLSGWTTGDPSHWTISTVGPYQGTYCVRITGAALTSMQSTTKPAIRVGDTISVSVMARITNAGTDDAHFQAVLQWLDGSGNLLPGAGGYVPGNEVQGVGGFWVASTASGVAPTGAAAFNISLSANPGTHGSVIDVDSASYTYATAAPSAGLVYKATQAAPGKSGASEPVWPAAGASVTDNQVTWLGEYATRLIWQASPILQSGTAEPTWPTQVGAVVHDGTIDWTARSAQITDPNCPQSKIVAIGAGKVFAADNDIVRYCATVNPLDWSSANDAGYLPTGLQTYGSNPVAAMGLYRSNLVVYNAEGFQMWQLDPDPANIALLDALPVASTHNRALAPTANDLFFLSSQGVRSMGISSAGVNLEAGDVGMPIDVLVKDSLRVANANGNDIVSTYVPSLGQYMVAFPNYPPPPLTLSGNLPSGALGDTVNYQYAVSGGVLPIAISLVAGSLPPGLSMNASGLVTGTLTTVGNYTWTVRATDSYGSVSDLPQANSVIGVVIAKLHFDANMTTDDTGRVWTVNSWTEQIGYTPWLIWPQWDGATYASGPGSFRMSRAGTASSPEQGFYYGQARMYSALGTSGAIDSTTDFCIEGFVRRDPGDDNGGGNTMFLDFGIQLWARQSNTVPRSVSLENVPVGMTVTYTTVDRTIPTDRFIHFALVRAGSTITLWWGGQAAATVSSAQLLTLASTFPVSLGTSQSAYTAWQMPGWLDEIRITKGWARYTQAFTPPSGRIS